MIHAIRPKFQHFFNSAIIQPLTIENTLETYIANPFTYIDKYIYKYRINIAYRNMRWGIFKNVFKNGLSNGLLNGFPNGLLDVLGIKKKGVQWTPHFIKVLYYYFGCYIVVVTG